jgi:D-beta-D-heptose 7-phosphate kinase/D-beta-D-heptose 1-phosphate adenosyltransferase
MKIIIVSGGFDPLHSGHIAHFKAAKELGDILIVGLNSDDWLTRKKGKPFMPIDERLSIIRELRVVDLAFTFNDDDNSSRDLIKKVLDLYKSDVIFANGGDRTQDNIPEMEQFKDDSRVSFEFGVGGEDKKNSSSWILSNWRTT